jgi:solute carrier family 25 carnitine/acylcarnitine transporter 20/29
MGFPLASVPIVNAVVFAVNELSKRCLGFHDENEMTIFEGMMCGGIAGFANCAVVTPVELVKCRLQMQMDSKPSIYNSSSGNRISGGSIGVNGGTNVSGASVLATTDHTYYKGILDCIRKIRKYEGIRALYKGNVITILREIPAYGAQFGGYYYAKQLIAKFKKKRVEELGHLDLMISGSVGGFACWQFSYPQDVIKTILQTDKKNKFKSKFFDGGFLNCAKDLYNREGFFGFWKGYTPCMARALIANGILFVTYENSKNYLSKYNDNDNDNDDEE